MCFVMYRFLSIEEKYITKDDDEIWLKDNAAAHAALIPEEFCSTRGLVVLSRSTKSPELNIWGCLVRLIYYGFRQFESV